jgi:hypothetical protein
MNSNHLNASSDRVTAEQYEYCCTSLSHPGDSAALFKTLDRAVKADLPSAYASVKTHPGDEVWGHSGSPYVVLDATDDKNLAGYEIWFRICRGKARLPCI